MRLITILLLMLCCITLFGQNNFKYKFENIIKFFPLGTGSTTGTYYPLGQAFSNVLNDKLKSINVMALSTNGSEDNIRLMERGELKLGIAQSDTFYFAVNKRKNFKSDNFTNLRAILSLYPEVVQMVVPKDSKINSFRDLFGKKVIIGPRGSGNVVTAKTVLSYFGLNDNNYTPGYLSFDKAVQALENKDYDAFFLVAGLPTKAFIELQSRIDLKIIGFKPKDIKELCLKYSYFSSITIDKSVYKSINEKVNTIALRALLFTTDSVKENDVFLIISTIFDNLKYLSQIHPRAKDISLKTYDSAIPKGYLHKGSKKFYESVIRKTQEEK